MGSKTIKTNGSQLFNVPNTDEGRAFVAQCRRWANWNAVERIWPRGRGARVAAVERVKAEGGMTYRSGSPRTLFRGSFHQDLPVREAEWLAVYVTPFGSLGGENRRKLIKLRESVKALTAENERLDAEVGEWRERADVLEGALIEANETVETLTEARERERFYAVCIAAAAGLFGLCAGIVAAHHVLGGF